MLDDFPAVVPALADRVRAGDVAGLSDQEYQAGLRSLRIQVYKDRYTYMPRIKAASPAQLEIAHRQTGYTAQCGEPRKLDVFQEIVLLYTLKRPRRAGLVLRFRAPDVLELRDQNPNAGTFYQVRGPPEEVWRFLRNEKCRIEYEVVKP